MKLSNPSLWAWKVLPCVSHQLRLFCLLCWLASLHAWGEGDRGQRPEPHASSWQRYWRRQQWGWRDGVRVQWFYAHSLCWREVNRAAQRTVTTDVRGRMLHTPHRGRQIWRLLFSLHFIWLYSLTGRRKTKSVWINVCGRNVTTTIWVN